MLETYKEHILPPEKICRASWQRVVQGNDARRTLSYRESLVEVPKKISHFRLTKA